MDDNYRHPAEERKIKFKSNNLGSKNDNKVWIFLITILSFFLSISLLLISSKILQKIDNYLIAICVVVCIIFVGVVFDIIGIAATAADEAPFHSMASRKLYGAKQAILLVRNANKVSAFCNDVVGDICGVISGTASAVIVYKISGRASGAETSLVGLAISGMVASMTVGGKAIGKTLAMQNSNYIIYKVAVILKFVFGRISMNGQKIKSKR